MNRQATFLAMSVMVLSFVGCSGNNTNTSASPSSAIANAVLLNAKASQAAGTVLPAGQTVHVYILAAGQNLFTNAGSSCLHDPYTPGVFERDVITGEGGAITLSFGLADLGSAVDTTCAMNMSARLGQLDHMQVQLSIAADQVSCATLCQAQIPGSIDACVAACTTGDRKITSGVTYNHTQLAQMDMTSRGGIATISLNPTFNSLGIPIAQTGNLPDLIVDGPSAANSWRVTTENFSPTDCAVVEGCVAAGTRTLLRFDGSFINAGTGDFVLGSPESNPLFVYSSCHNHYHLKGVMLYQLLVPGTLNPVASASGQAVGRKQGFCVEDLNVAAGFQDGKYTCENQGLTPGWEDVYDGSLDCQWIDITGVPPGNYILRITVNPTGTFPEADTTNNDAEVLVTVPANPPSA